MHDRRDTRTMHETLTRCQQECTRLLQAYREVKLGGITEHVKAFRRLFGYPIRTIPIVPSADESRLHLRIVADEFCELLEAHGLQSWRWRIMDTIARDPLKVDLSGWDDADVIELSGAGDMILSGFARPALAHKVIVNIGRSTLTMVHDRFAVPMR